MSRDLSENTAEQSEPMHPDRVRAMLVAAADQIIRMVPGQFRPFAPALRSNTSALIDRVLGIPSDDLAVLVDRVRWELAQSRKADPAAPVPLNARERDALRRLIDALPD